MNEQDIKTEIELLKKDIDFIKNNHLVHMAKDIDNLSVDMKDVKRAIFKAQYVMYGAIVVFVLMSDKFTEILKLL
jgi:TATA-binding protein-associated factor Taf7